MLLRYESIPWESIVPPNMRVSFNVEPDVEAFARWLLTLDPAVRPTADDVVDRLAGTASGKASDERALPLSPAKTQTRVKRSPLVRHVPPSWRFEWSKSVDLLVSVAFKFSLLRLSLHASIALLDAYVANCTQPPPAAETRGLSQLRHLSLPVSSFRSFVCQRSQIQRHHRDGSRRRDSARAGACGASVQRALDTGLLRVVHERGCCENSRAM